MKNILFAFVLLMGTITLNAQKTETVKNAVYAPIAEPLEDFDANSAIFNFEKEVIDYGTIEKNADGNRVFIFTNTGGSPLIISNAKGSCGCTVPTWPKEPIMPGEKGEIGVKYATGRVGRFSKTITLTSNASETKKIIRIKGEVLNNAPK
jgi:hypothetical protein